MNKRKVSGILFALAFGMIFIAEIKPVSFISSGNARLLSLIFGGLAMILNLINYQKGKHSPRFNFFFWLGAILLFAGIANKLVRGDLNLILFISGLTILLFSFIFSTIKNKESKSETDEILDEEL